MAFFEELGRRVSDFGQGVATKTKNFSDVSKLNSAIADLERQIANAYAGIGKAYYEAHKDDPNAEQREGIAYINSAMEQIHQNQEQVKVILENPERQKAGPTAPAQGLCLMSVDYD